MKFQKQFCHVTEPWKHTHHHKFCQPAVTIKVWPGFDLPESLFEKESAIYYRGKPVLSMRAVTTIFCLEYVGVTL